MEMKDTALFKGSAFGSAEQRSAPCKETAMSSATTNTRTTFCKARKGGVYWTATQAGRAHISAEELRIPRCAVR
eukprot:2276992-Amphidinium_carterae.3